MGLRDDYNFWFAGGEAGHAGKLCIVSEEEASAQLRGAQDSNGSGDDTSSPQSSVVSHRVRHLFFDDNIGHAGDEACIRDPHLSGQQVAAMVRESVEISKVRQYEGARKRRNSADAHIVDVRTEKGDAVPFRQVRNTCLVRVDPISAILNDNYFVQLVQMCECNL
jgi:hypothetical protein